MLFKIGQGTDHGFDAPLGLLSDCHRRIERFLAALLTVARERRGAPLPDADRKVLEAGLHYFATAAPRHAADEEASLFPRLRASADPLAHAALDTIERLEVDHRVAEAHHTAVDGLGRRWLCDGMLPEEDAAEMVRHLDILQRLYHEHIHVEDQELFPAASRVLTPADIEAVGREMAACRNVPFTPPPGL